MKRCTEFVSYNENGYLVKLPKRGDLGLCKNWRGIMLLSVPSKVFCWIILERLKHALDRKLHCLQAGFRKDKSCTDHIATLRIIIEQSTEWQTPLYMNFIDFEKAFDSVDRVTVEFHQNLSNWSRSFMKPRPVKLSTTGSFQSHLKWTRESDKSACCHQWSS